jgi:hypothetical protein
MPVAVTHPGKVFWVSNASTLSDRQVGGSDGNAGTYDAPCSTITGALAKCTANRGDIIMVKPGHAETVTAAAGIILSKAGVAIIGLGVGSTRPTITLSTANTASITVTANNVTVSNVLFLASFLNIATVFSVANAQVATDFCVDNCEFRDTSNVLNFVSCVKIGTTANIADGLTFTNNKVVGVSSAPAAATTAVVSASSIDRAYLAGNTIIHTTALIDTANLLAMGATDLTHAVVEKNKTFRPSTSTTGELITSSSTASSGVVSENFCAHLDNSAGLIIPTGTKLSFFNNFSMVTGAADKSALINPAAV